MKNAGWDANSGGISLVRGAAVMPNGTVRLELDLEPHATMCIVVGAPPPGAQAVTIQLTFEMK